MTDDAWWRGAVIYQIYPRSFQDTNGDGVGDLPGIARRLDYVASLGVDAVWISPFFKSPMADFGYDVADFRGVDPLFGRLADFDRLVAEAHRLGLKVMIDQVMSHTSSQHPWFLESRESRDGGFSSAAPWLPIPPEHLSLAVSRQEPDPASPLNAFRRFLHWRHDQPALRLGEIRFIPLAEPLLAFTRSVKGQTVLAVLNLSKDARQSPLPLLGQMRPFDGHGLPAGRIEDRMLLLPGYGAWFASVT